MKSLNLFAALLLSLMLGTGLVFAQSDRGTVRGTVTDPGDAVVPNAKVTLTGVENGEKRETTTGDEGIFVFPEVQAALYTLTVEAGGFSRTSVENIKVDVQGIQSVTVKLEVGEVTGNVVTVNAEAVSINSDTPVRQTNVDERQVRELPLLAGGEADGRTPLAFIFLDSNVTAGASNSTDGTNSTSKFRVSGGQASGTEILIDGASVRRTQNGTFFSETAPSPNAFQEFTISTNSFSAEFGNSSGGVVNFSLKSGTNEFHGEGYDYLRNEIFNANDILSNARGFDRNRDNRNNYGFNVGGPIYVPNFGEGNSGGFLRSLKDRAFFFFHYEGYRLRQGRNALVTVPTVRMRTGDFSELLNTNDPNVRFINGGNQVVIYDPRFPSNVRQAIPGNRLDLVGGTVLVNGVQRPLIDPAGFAILQRFPLPTRPGILNNYDAAGVRPTDTNQFTVKTDFVLTSKQRLSVSYSRRDTERLAGAFPVYPLPFTNQGVFAQEFKSNIARIQHDYSISSNVLNHLNIGYTFFDVANRNTTDPFNTSSLGIPIGSTQNRAFPRVGFPGYLNPADPRNVQDIGSTEFTDQLRDGTFEISDFVTFVTGRHSFKFGGSYRNAQFNVRQAIDPGGSFNFRNDQTAADECGNCGYPIASLITGATEFAFNSNNSIDPAFRQLTQSYFVQDDIKVNQKLTLNIGLRYDLPGLRLEADDRFRGFEPDVANPQAGSRLGALVGAGGQGGLRAEYRTLAPNDKSNIGPRLGAAYAFDSKTVVRGGIGLYYSPVLYGGGDGRGDINSGTIGYNSGSGALTPEGRNARNFLSTFPAIPRTDPNSQFLGADVTAFGQFGNGFHNGRTLQYTIDVQRELPYRLVGSIGYIGHRADRLRSNFGRPNALPLNALKLGNEILRTDINGLSSVQRDYAASVGVAIPANGAAVYVERLADGTTRPFTGNVAQALRPFPQYNRINDELESEGESNYNALQIKVDRRFAQGFQFGASYTFSRLVTNASDDILGFTLQDGVLQNPYDTEALKTISPTNSPHVFVTNFLAELPFGKGKALLNRGGIVDKIFGGFQVSGIFRIQQGLPLVFSLDPSNGPDNGFLELAGIYGRLRPNLTGQPIGASQRVADPTNPGRFFILNPAAFAAPPSFNGRDDLNTPQIEGPPPFLLLNGTRNPAYAAYYADPTRFFGNAPIVNTDFRADRFYTADMSILKKTRITETVVFEVGAEFFNVFNQVFYLPPDTLLGRQTETGGINSNLNFGAEGFSPRLSDAGNRVIQLRARIIF